MAMVVNHNIPALTTYNTVNRTNSALEKSIQKLSTGLRINSAADDAAGLAISEKMRSQIRGMDRAVSNAQDGISMIQTAEGALNETHDILQRMRELSVQAANDTLTSQDRSYIQLEIDELRDEVTRIGNTTQFNKKKLLNGDAAVLWSSSDLSTKAIVNGGLRTIDQFGQKSSAEGNYKITIKADPGQAEVQKSDIFKIKHPNVLTNVSTNPELGVKSVSVNNVPAGDYTIKGADAAPTDAADMVGGVYNVDAAVYASKGTLTGDTTALTQSTVGEITKSVKVGDKVVGKYTLATTEPMSGTFLSVISKWEDAGGNVTTLTTGGSSDTSAKEATVIKDILTKASSDGVIPTFTMNTAGEYVLNSTSPIGAVSVDGGTIKATLNSTDDGTTANSATIDQIVVASAPTNDLIGNANVLFEVTDVNMGAKTVTLKATANILKADGTTMTKYADDIVLTAGTAKDLNFLGESTATPPVAAVNLTLDETMMGGLHEGSKFVYNFTKGKSGDGKADFFVDVSGDQTSKDQWSGNWSSANGNSGVTNKPVVYGLADSVAGQEIHFKNYYLDEKTGEATLGEIILSTNENFTKANIADDTDVLATFHSTYIGEVASDDVKLRDLDKFWTSEGVFMLNDPQTITITQGDGKQASITLYATDTLGDVRDKLNNAIATDLGQGQYVNVADHFASFVTKDNVVATGDDSVKGTFVIRSVVPGDAGTLSFSGDENVINAFSLNVLHNPSESTYNVTVKDAHTDEVLASDVQVTGNVLKGVIHPNVDVQFDPLTGVSGSWNSKLNRYEFDSSSKETILHLTDNTTVFQIGANEGEDMGVHIGDMRATALGLDSVNVMNRESAARSITILDNAIDKVSTQRAKLGAYQNRLEHTVNNLNTATENITAAESRIRDTDMAKEMMNFTKLQIMLQAGTSMLAQANQLPQNVMALVR